MSTVTDTTGTQTSDDRQTVAPDTVDLARLGQLLGDLADQSPETPEMALQELLRLVRRMTGTAGVFYFRRSESNQLTPGPWDAGSELVADLNSLSQHLVSWCEVACQQQTAQLNRLDNSGNLVAISVPVLRHGSFEALVAIAVQPERGSAVLAGIVQILQLIAAYAAQWSGSTDMTDARRQLEHTSGLLDTVTRAGQQNNLKTSCQELAQGLRQYLGCQQVAVGTYRSLTRRCHLQAISDHRGFDRQSEVVRSLEAVMEESVLRRSPGVWEASDSNATPTEAPKKLAALTNASVVISAPLTDTEGTAIGAWVVIDGQAAHSTDRTKMVVAADAHLGSCLHLLRRAQPSPARIVIEAFRGKHRKYLLAALAVVLGILMLPLPYKVACRCEVQPVTRRFVAVPYEGRLKEALVEPGDVVAAGEVVARMDDREIRWELTGLEAQHNQAQKQSDASLADHDTSTAQLAALEMERLDVQMQLLSNRLDNLEIRSPIAGLVVSGDPEKTEGARMSMGQTIVEVAPLDRMVIELKIADEDISHVKPGHLVRFRLDSLPWSTQKGDLQRVHPRSETRDADNVFIGEIELDNPDGVLRPGMRGRAKIRTDRHLLAWNLFHKAWDRLTARIAGW